MKPSIWDILTGVLLLGMLCLACAFTQIFFNPTASFNPFPPPTAVPQIVLAIPTATETVVLRELPPTWTPTPTSEGTPTPAFTLRPSSTLPPTATMFFMPTGTATATVTRTPTATRADARCQVVDESPRDNAQFSPGQEFDKRWTLRNRSGDSWRADNMDVRHLSGAKLHTGADVYDLPRDIGNNDTYEFTVRMRAPSSAGTYTANWGIVNGGTSICNFYVLIVVK